jgi:hypothetical protein
LGHPNKDKKSNTPLLAAGFFIPKSEDERDALA